MTEDLTPKQQKILNFVRKSIEKTGFPPTRVEISKAFNYSSANAAEEHLRMLERKGAIELTPGASRGIRLTEGLGLPLVGRVAAGSRSRMAARSSAFGAGPAVSAALGSRAANSHSS